jgi:hypothetical protein
MQSKSERRIRDSSIVKELLRIGVIVLAKMRCCKAYAVETESRNAGCLAAIIASKSGTSRIITAPAITLKEPV